VRSSGGSSRASPLPVPSSGNRSGQASATAIGTRMSGTPSCASTEPSQSSMSECTTDCGCTTTSMRSGGVSKSQRASITSRPLFISVAESIVIFGPIDQFGCASASSIVARAMRSADQVRNGPPEAVSTMRSRSCGRWPASTWKIALCSLSTGSKRTPRAFTSRSTSAPAITITSLFASATSRPARIAASVGSSPTAPTNADTTRSASAVATSVSPASPNAIAGASAPS